MHLTRLEILGFKSFAAQTVLVFDKNITAIVGPNGSGKSNIADALRWVLGEQSMKNLRGKRAEDIIFSGSKDKRRLGLARVEITLDNADGRGALEYSEIVISREMDRSGESTYRLNGHTVNLSDIIMFLAKSHFGQKSYAIIGQGTIDRIVNATPESRKDFFDEATGVKALQIKRDHSVNKLIRTEEHLLQVEGLVNEIEPRLRSLKRQVQRLQKRSEIESELHDVHLQYFGSLWHDIETKTARLAREEHDFSERRKKLEEVIATLQKESDAIAKDTSANDALDKLRETRDRLETEKNTLLKEHIILKGRMELEQEKRGAGEVVLLERRVTELATKRTQLTRDLETVTAQTKKLETLIAEKTQEEEHLFRELKETEYRMLKSREAAGSPKDLPMPKLRELLGKLYSRYEDLLHKLFKTKPADDLDSLRNAAKEITLEFADLIDQLEEHDHEKFAREADILQQQLTNATEKKERLTARLLEWKVEKRSQSERKNFLQNDIANLTAEHTAAQKEYDQAKSEHSGNATPQSQKNREEVEKLNQRIHDLENGIRTHDEEMTHMRSKEQRLREDLLSRQQEARSQQNELNVVNQKSQEVAIARARYETRREDVLHEIHNETIAKDMVLIKNFKPADSLPNVESLGERAQQLKKQLELIGGIDPETLKEHDETNERFTFLSHEATDLRTAMMSLHKVIDELDKTIKTQFEEAFKHINRDFKKYFGMLFSGGDAQLELLQHAPEEETPETEETPEQEAPILPETLKKKKRKILSGIDIRVHPPGKKITNVSMLSGGEKSLVAIALLSAILHTNPSPFVILDEVEAALDEANSRRFADILEELNKRTQFILITHNREIMKQSDVLYGVTMSADGVSKLLSIKMEDLQDKHIGKSAPQVLDNIAAKR